MKNSNTTFNGQVGRCGDREVFVGFAQASVLAALSFPDLLDETTGKGYQRRFSREHSLEFKRYIQKPGASTIPLTFNLRGAPGNDWRLERAGKDSGFAKLHITSEVPQVMAQVDCQHRLGFLHDSSIVFAFMTYLGLSVEEKWTSFASLTAKRRD
ncbi:MAG: hypothetical protein IPI73_24570 [Betaproteobacteria bacterium]|nr:hypothetical protein [Betaproteobacteria bacterium]